MKKLIAFAIAALLTTVATAQTISTLRTKHNRHVCALAGLPASCTQAEFDATGKANGTVYATDATFRDAVIVKRAVQRAVTRPAWERHVSFPSQRPRPRPGSWQAPTQPAATPGTR